MCKTVNYIVQLLKEGGHTKYSHTAEYLNIINRRLLIAVYEKPYIRGAGLSTATEPTGTIVEPTTPPIELGGKTVIVEK